MSSEVGRHAALVLLLAAAGCADVERGPRPPVPEAGPDLGASDGGGLSFAVVVRPLLIDACQRCHSAGGMAADTDLLFTGEVMADLTAVRGFVDVNTPARSRLLAKASGQGHQGGAIYKTGSEPYTTLLAWIAGGAQP